MDKRLMVLAGLILISGGWLGLGCDSNSGPANPSAPTTLVVVPTNTPTITPTTVPTGFVLISEVRTRGSGGAGDEFVEFYNPGGSPVVLDSSWALQKRASSASSYSNCWMGTGKTLASHHHFLVTGTSYVQTPAGDETLSSALTDAGSLVLTQNGTTIDALGYYFDSTTLAQLSTGIGFILAGTPAVNPHDNSNGTNTDQSLERKPGGSGGNATNTSNNANDFQTTSPADPENSASPAVP